MRLFQGLFIYAMFVNKSEEKNDKDASCFNFGELGHSRLKGPSNMGSEYAVVNLTHSYRFYSLDTGFSERIVVTNISFLFESGMKRVMDLYAEGEVTDGNPRKLAVAFDGTLLEAAIGEHEMFYVPSYNITSDEWECWNWSKPLPLDNWQLEGAETSFCTNNTEAENGTLLILQDDVELAVKKFWRPPHFNGNEDTECFTSQLPSGEASESVNSTPAPPSKVIVEVKHHSNTSQVQLTEGEVTVVQVWYNSWEPEIFEDQNPRNLSLYLHEEVVWAGLALLEEKRFYQGQELGWSYSTWWTCDGGSVARLPIPSGSQTNSTAKLPLYAFYWDDSEYSDVITVSVMGDGTESAVNQYNSLGKFTIFLVLYISFS